jgi:hypothetical protein
MFLFRARVWRPPVVILQATGDALVDRRKRELLREAEHVPGHRVHAIAFGEPMHPCAAAPDAVGVPGKEKSRGDADEGVKPS